MTKEEIIKAAEYCNENYTCGGCPLVAEDVGESCRRGFAKYILAKETEPAPPEGDTSSQKNYLQKYNNTISAKCQVFEYCDRAVTMILQIYENMNEAEQRAFDLGEVYRDVLCATVEIEDAKLKGGTGYER